MVLDFLIFLFLIIGADDQALKAKGKNYNAIFPILIGLVFCVLCTL